MMLTRRKLIGGLGLLIAAPAVIRVAQLMPIKSWVDPRDYEISSYHEGSIHVSFGMNSTATDAQIKRRIADQFRLYGNVKFNFSEWGPDDGNGRRIAQLMPIPAEFDAFITSLLTT